MLTIDNLAPSYAIQGSADQTTQEVERFLQRLYCTQNIRSEQCWCSTCKKIVRKQHPPIIWIDPEKEYTTRDIACVFEKTAFALNDDEQIFFVFQGAERLTSICANRLLKRIEEPPPGYHFIFLTTNIRSLAPTIISRCLIMRLDAHDQKVSHPLLPFFTDHSLLNDPISFTTTLKKQKLSHSQAKEFLYELIHKTSMQLRDTAEFHALHLQQKLAYLQKIMRKPPQTGSAQLFLKMVYLSLPRE